MNNYENKVEVIKNRCRISAKVFGILRMFPAIGCITSLMGMIICILYRPAINEKVAAAVTQGELNLDNLEIGLGSLLRIGADFTEFYQEGNYAMPFIIACIIATVVCAIAFVLITLFKRIFVELSLEETPFSDSVMKKIKISFIILTVILLGVGLGPGLMGGLSLWCIYSILDYGKALQTEVDEIL